MAKKKVSKAKKKVVKKSAGKKKDPRVDAYIKNAKPFAQPILKKMRAAVHAAVPRVTEDMKWRMPWFLIDGKLLCGMPAFKAHCVFVFWSNGSHKLQVKNTPEFAMLKKLRRIESIDELPSAATLKSLVKKVAALRVA